MHEFEFSVSEYLGTLENGVLAIIAIIYRGNYFEGTFFYTKTDFVFTISEELESYIGDIHKHPHYLDMIKVMLRITVPFDQMYYSLDPVNFTSWAKNVMELSDLVTPMIMETSEATKPRLSL